MLIKLTFGIGRVSELSGINRRLLSKQDNGKNYYFLLRVCALLGTFACAIYLNYK